VQVEGDAGESSLFQRRIGIYRVLTRKFMEVLKLVLNG